MAHTFDTKLRFTGSSAPLTTNYTCGAGSTVLVLSLVVAGTTPRSGGAPTFNGVALTQAGTTRGNATGYETGTELWYLLSPPAGAAYQVSVPNGGTAKTIYAIASTYKSATGVSALDGANGSAATTGANPSVSVTTTVNGAAIVASMGNGLATAPTGRTGTSLYETDDGSYSDSGQYLLQASAGAQAMGWTIATDDWCICVAAFKEAPLAKSGTATITGGGPLTATSKKGGNQPSTITGGRDIAGAIRKGALVLAVVGILGHALATGFKAYPLTLSGGGMKQDYSLTDDFNRSDENPLLGYDNCSGGEWSPIRLISQQVQGTTGTFFGAMPNSLPGDAINLYAEILCSLVPVNQGPIVGVCCSNPSALDGIFFIAGYNGTDVYRVDGGIRTEILWNSSAPWRTGDVARIEVTGGTWTVRKNGAIVGSGSTYGKTGRPLVGTMGGAKADNFSCAVLVQVVQGKKSSSASVSITAGGTVAGTGSKWSSGNLSLNTFFEDFNRADCDITYGPWTKYWDYPAAVVSNRFTGTQAGYHSAALYTGPGAYPNDQKAEYVLVSPGLGSGGGFGRGVLVRASASGGYYVTGLGPGTLRINKALSGNMIGDVSLTLAPGDRIALEAIGSSPVTLNLYQNDILRWTYQDNTNLALSGTPGIISIVTMITSPTDNFKTWIDRTLRGGGSLTVYGVKPEPPHYGTLTISGGGVAAVVGVKGLFASSYVVVRDNFDRADEDPLNPAIWTPINIGFGAPLGHKVSSQKAVARKNGDCATLFVQAPTSRSQYVQATMSRGGMFYNYTNGLLLKDDAANTFGFRVSLSEGANDAAVRIYLQIRIPAYPYWTAVETLLIEALPSPAILRLEADSSNMVRVYVNGILRITRPNPGWEGSPITGQGGIYSSWPERTIDNFELGWAVAGFTTTGGGIVALQGKKGGLSEPSAVVYAQDNFNRADTSMGNLGPNWYPALALISGQKVRIPFDADSVSYWVGAGAFGVDQSSEVVWPDVSSGNAVKCGPAVRVQSNGNRRYEFRGSISGLKSYAGIYVYTPSMYIVGGFVDTSWITAGSKVRLKVVGNVLSVYVNGSLWYSATDTANRVPSGGVPGFVIGHSVAWVDDFVSAGDKPPNLQIYGGGPITVAGHKDSSVAVAVNGGGTIYASAREEAYRAVSIHSGGAIVLAGRKGANSAIPIPGGGIVSVQTRKDALVVVRVSGNGINTGEAVVNARGLVWALLRGGGDITVAFIAGHPGSAAVTGGGSIVVKWVRSWPYRPVTEIGDPDATALLVEIDLEACTREFGVSPCLGTGASCYKTWGTCKYIYAFSPTKRTYRFCSADYPQIFPDARPYLIAVKWLATEIRQNLTVNARVVLDFIDEPDTDVGFDPYWSQRANHPGTFWKKFFARNINYRGRFVRVYEGRPGAAESTYVLRWTGRLDNVTASGSQFSLESVDILKDISKIEVPPKVSAKLAADIAAAYNVSFSITEDADKFPNSGYVRIEDEIIKYESKDDLTKVFSLLSRGQFGTVDSNHPAGEKVQPARYFAPKSGYDHLLDMLLVDGAIDPVYVDSPSFFFYRDWPQADIDFTAVVSEPTKLSTLFYEVLDLLDSKAWVSENFKITVRRNVQNQPGRQYYPLDDETSLIDKTVKVDLNEDSRITRVAIFWDLKVVSKSTDQTSYRKIDLAVNPDAETNYDGPIEKKILCRWIDPTIAEEEKVMRYVRNLALRRIVRERDAQTIIHIEVAPKDAGVLTGEFIFLTSNETLAADGEPLSAVYQVVKRERKKDSYALTLSKIARRKICLIAPSGFPPYASATDAQREYGFVSDVQGKMSDFKFGYFIW